MVMKEKSGIRVLFLTYEFGENIKGGVGRVINTLVSLLSDKMTIDILLLSSFMKRFSGTFYQKEKNGYVKKITGLIEKIYPAVFRDNVYNVVHAFTISKEITDIIKYIRGLSSSIKVFYSCHSIGAYERNIRNIYADMLPHENYMILNSDRVHVLNRTSHLIVREYFPSIQKERLCVIPNGINPEELTAAGQYFKNKIKKQSTDQYTVLTMSRWCHGKGLEILLDAVPFVLEEIKNVKFIISGRKKRSWEKNVREYVGLIDRKIKKINKNVIALGWLDDLKRNYLYSLADVWVMPSLLEYFPYSLLEPMAAQVPVISARFFGIEEMVEEEKECLLYDPLDPRELAGHIVRLLKDKDKRESLAAAAYKRVKNDFNWAPIGDRYYEMYHL